MKEKGRCKSGRGRYNGEPVTSRNLCHPRNCGLKQLPVIGLVTQTVPARLPQARGQPQVSRAQLPVSWQPPPSASSSLLCDSPSWSCPSWSTQQREARGAGRLAPGSGRSAISSAFFCAGWLVGPVRSRAGEQGCLSAGGGGAERPPPGCCCHKPSRPPRTSFLGSVLGNRARSWSCLFKEPLEIQLLSGPCAALPTSSLPPADVSRLFRPPQPSGVCLEGHTGACRAVTSGGSSGREACPSLIARRFSSAFYK